MQIKPIARLKPSDLPFAESPDLAVRFVARHSRAPLGPRFRFDWTEFSGLPVHSKPEVVRERVLNGLRNGDLILIFDPITSERPLSPLAVWRNDSDLPDGGSWHLGLSSSWMPGLERLLEQLHRQRISPRSLVRSGVGGSYSSKGEAYRKLGPPMRSGEFGGANTEVFRGSAPGVPASHGLPLEGVSGEVGRSTPLHITAGVFTDGTLNNGVNTAIFKERLESECLAPLRDDPAELARCKKRLRLLLGESYANELTNVHKLWQLYQESVIPGSDHKSVTIAVYSAGPGTRNGGDDAFLGMVSGLGENGVESQVKRAFSDLAFRIADESSGNDIEKITFDFFGFSRGAAAARHAINEILKGREGMLGSALSARELNWPDAISVRFVGLFDTVAGIVNLKTLDLWAGNDKNFPLDIGLDSRTVDAVVHLTARDEKRENFALNSLRNDKGWLAPNFREIELPGAHSDIGGGYPKLQLENNLLYPTQTITGASVEWPEQTSEWDTLSDLKRTIEAEGWIGHQSLRLPDGTNPRIDIDKNIDEHPVPSGRVELSLRMERRIKGELSNVALHLMHGLALKNGVPLRALPGGTGFQVPEELRAIYERAREQVLQGQNRLSLTPSQEQLLRQRYIHHSDHFNLVDFLVRDRVWEAEIPFLSLVPSRPELSRQREIHPNTSRIN